MEKLIIRLLHERRGSRAHRKVDGKSGKTYLFMWDEKANAFTYPAENNSEIIDLFENVGRPGCAYFAPVLIETQPAKPKPISGELALMLLKHDIELPKGHDDETVARAVVENYLRGFAAGAKEATAQKAENVPAQPPAPPVEKPARKNPNARQAA